MRILDVIHAIWFRHVKYGGEMAVELKCSLAYLVDHERLISASCGSLPYTSIKNIFNTQEPYGQSKSEQQDSLQHLSACSLLHKNDSLPRVCFPRSAVLIS
jgi:hypothetical protein